MDNLNKKLKKLEEHIEAYLKLAKETDIAVQKLLKN